MTATPISTTTAQALTAEQVQKILIEPLESASVFLAAGPRKFVSNGSPVRIPKLGAATDPGFIGENEQIGEVEQDFSEITLLPSTIKSIKTITRFSNELARQSILSLSEVLQQRLVIDVASKLDKEFIAGDGGSGTTPLGVLNYSGTQVISSVGAVALDPFMDAIGELLAANVDISSCKLFVRPETFTALRKIKDGNERYQLQPDPTQDGVFRLFGIPVTVTDRIPKTTGDTPTTQAFIADFAQIAVAVDQAPSVKILDQTYADYDQMAIRVTARYDAAPLNAEAIVRLDGISL